MKIGVIGIGRWGTKVAREYIALKEEGIIEEVILCDIDSSRLKQFSDVAIVTTSLDDVLNKVDGIHICTPNSTHYEIAKKALERDVHVLVEKPMAESLTDSFKLMELAISKNLILQVGHIFRFANIVRTIKKLFLNGYFGKLIAINLQWTHLIDPIPNIDVIYDLLPHPLDIINFITGDWPIEFSGVGKKVRTNAIEICYLQAYYESGLIANIHLSWLSPIRRRYIEIIGSKHTLIGDCVIQEAKIYDNEGNCKKLEITPNNTIREEILNFIKAIRNGKNEPNSGIIGIRSIEAVEKARKSIMVIDNEEKI